MGRCNMFALLILVILLQGSAASQQRHQRYEQILASLEELDLSCAHSLTLSYRTKLFESMNSNDTPTHVSVEDENDSMNVFAAVLSGVWSLIPQDIAFFVEQTVHSTVSELRSMFRFSSEASEQPTTSASVSRPTRIDDMLITPLYELHDLAVAGHAASVACLAELRMFSSNARIPEVFWSSLPLVDLTASNDTTIAQIAKVCASKVALESHPRCVAGNAAAVKRLLLSYQSASDAIIALSTAACLANEMIWLKTLETLRPVDVDEEIDLDAAGNAHQTPPILDRGTVWSALPTLASARMPFEAAIRLDAHTPHWHLPLSKQFDEHRDDIPIEWQSLSHVMVLPGLLLHTDIAVTLVDDVGAFAESMSVLAMLHLAHVRVRMDSVINSVGWNDNCAESSADKRTHELASSVTALINSWSGYFFRTSSDKHTSRMSVGAYINTSATVFPNDEAALDMLTALAYAGTWAPLASIVTANEWMYGPISPLGQNYNAQLTSHDFCMQAVSLILPIVQDAVMQSSAAVTVHAEETYASLWEAHEDAFVATAAKDTQLNVEMLREEADVHNDPLAQLQMGEVLMYGLPQANVAADAAAAQHYFQRAADAGNVDAAAQLGMLLLDGGGGAVPVDINRARELLEGAAAQQNVHALAGLGYLYETGTGVPRNYSKAVEYLEQAAAAGAINAHSNLGALYLLPNPNDPSGVESDGVVFNATAAAEHLRVSHEFGFAPATFNLGLIELNGWIRSAPNCSGAMHYWLTVARRARWLGRSPFNFGAAFDAFGTESAYDVAAAFRQYLMLAIIGSPHAADNAGFILQQHVADHVVDAFFMDPAAARTRNSIEHVCIACNIANSLPIPLPSMSTRLHSSLQATTSMNSTIVSHAAELYFRAAKRHHAHALKAVADCYIQSWEGVPMCDAAINSTINSDTSTIAALALQLLDQSAAAGFGHAYFTLAYAYASGRLGTSFIVAVNVSRAWEYLDYCYSIDPLSDWPVFFARLYVLQVWLYHEAVASFSDTGDSGAGLYALAQELFDCLLHYAEDDSGVSNEHDNGFVTSRSPFSTPAMTEAQMASYAEDAYMDTFAAENAARMSRAGAHIHKIGMLSVTTADRQLCTVVTRTALIMLLLAVCLFAGIGAIAGFSQRAASPRASPRPIVSPPPGLRAAAQPRAEPPALPVVEHADDAVQPANDAAAGTENTTL